MDVELPAQMPHRAALAVAAGAGPGPATDAVWEALDPTWARVRTALADWRPAGRAADHEELLRRRWVAEVAEDPHGITDATPGGRVLTWRTHLRAIGRAARAPQSPLQAPGRIVANITPHWWVTTRRLRRQAARAAERNAGLGILDRPIDAHLHRTDLARWGLALTEQPAILTRTLTMGSYPFGTPPAAPGGGPGISGLMFYGADLCGAVIGATLARGGPDAVHTGLTLAVTGSYGLAELCDVVAEVTPGADALGVTR